MKPQLEQLEPRDVPSSIADNPILDFPNFHPRNWYYKAATGPLFRDIGPLPKDVRQGVQLGDCSLLASLAALARKRPDFITNLVEENELDEEKGRNFTVHLSDGDITVDSLLVVNGRGKLIFAGSGRKVSNVIWPSIIEKAVAIHQQQLYATEGILPGESGWLYLDFSLVFSVADYLHLLTNIPVKEGYVVNGIPKDALVISTYWWVNNNKIHAVHAYAILWVEDDGAKLFNTWPTKQQPRTIWLDNEHLVDNFYKWYGLE